ncbi:TPA: TfoX family protein [Candidatus Saccharibacteria bacterium]|nr:TfoX family protein [Candidatus Saccharibacteria bacterium]HIO87920.1 TfoX family protein [Candidatus Saccharibacteria bacterium]
MTITQFKDYLVDEVFALLGDSLSVKRMFGGFGLYLDGRIFAVVLSDGQLALKVGDNNRQDFIDTGCKQWVYEGHKNKKPTTMPYWYAPALLFDDQLVAAEWARKSAVNSQ